MSTNKKSLARLKVKRRVRGKLSGTADCPRLSVFRSNKQIYAQIIDDQSGRTLASASSVSKDGATSQPKLEQASAVGTLIAEQAKNAGISNVVFDRNGYLFHGRVKQLAQAARDGGLKF
ncbi:MAG TPA: 50S ribosomal protein L18 [Flavobacteriales bacterium]|nr:50S ribosomal protein L18 [Flavobacteriales bacterium]